LKFVSDLACFAKRLSASAAALSCKRTASTASATNILWIVLNEGVQMAAIGAFLGLLGVFAAQKLISGLLFGVSALDPLTLAASALFLLAVVLMACWVPAWRAAQMDPCIALRAD
jgi:putative ABC transport system permease protein